MLGKTYEDTYLLLSCLEGPINIIIRSPNARNSILIVAEALFKMSPKLAEDHSISSLLVDLGPQSEPCTFSQGSEGRYILVIRAVEACIIYY